MIVLILVVTFILIVKIFEPRIKGYYGEKYIAKKLSKLPKEYSALHNILLKTERGTSQIDHVVCSEYGIFVIETKNYTGWITGSEQGEYWTQNIYGHKNKFRNPIRQNYGHKKALEEILGDDKQYYMIVAISGRANLKVQMKKEHVIYMKHINDCIKSLSAQKLYTNHDMNVMVKRLEDNRLTAKKDYKQHNETTHQKTMIAQKQMKAHICPKCGASLVQRHGKYGVFYGCSSYPKCRFTMKAK